MAELVLILGGSGTGKSRSIKDLDVTKTFLVNVADKLLPFKNEFKQFNSKEKSGNMITTANSKLIQTVIGFCEQNMNFDTYIIDDLQYIMEYEFFDRAKETGYQKFTDIGKNMYDLLMYLKSLPKEKLVFLLAHTEDTIIDNQKITKIKTIGKLLDEKLCIEGLCTIVLGTEVEKDRINKKLNYYFYTQNDGTNTLKSPEGMFESLKIENNLEIVKQQIIKYRS